MANYMNNMKSNKEAKMMNKVNKGQVTLEQLLALDKAGAKIDMNECENKIQLMQLKKMKEKALQNVPKGALRICCNGNRTVLQM